MPNELKEDEEKKKQQAEEDARKEEQQVGYAFSSLQHISLCTNDFVQFTLAQQYSTVNLLNSSFIRAIYSSV